MQFRAKPTIASKIDAQALILLVSPNWQKELNDLPRKLVQELVDDAGSEGFKGDFGKMYSHATRSALPAKTVFLVGVDKTENLTPAKIRHLAALIARRCRSTKKLTVALDLVDAAGKAVATPENMRALVEGMLLGVYEFRTYKSGEAETGPEMVYLLVPAPKLNTATESIAEGELYAQATNFARDLVNESPTVTTPAYLATEAKKLAKSNGITVEVLDKKDVEKMGMGAYLAVARGGNEPPKFIKLTYVGGHKKVVIAGKGITFDTGGLSLKDAKNMETMKLDMAGAAAVLGVFRALPKLKPKVTVIGLIAATENMPGPAAIKPGDIVRAMNGKTIEILNTDAEGRLTLADVLSYAVREKPEAIVDLATLTGACMVALGEDIAGLFANNPKLAAGLKSAAQLEGEKIWELPLEEDYRELTKSHIADLKNIAGRYGGAVTAALFLEEFVEKIPWAHLDIAGPSFIERDTPVNPRGGSGFGVRLLLEWLKNY